MMKLICVGALCLSVLTGCVSDKDSAAANKVITALPQEIDGCVFMQDLDSGIRLMLGQARFELKLDAAKMGATHIVETHVYNGLITPRTIGVGLSARAYRCPAGKGPLVDGKDALLEHEIPSYDQVFPENEL